VSETKPKPKSSWVNLAVDYGPLLVFFLAYRYFAPPDGASGLIKAAAQMLAVTKSTAAFMGATVVALLVSKLRLGKISPMLWLSTVLVLGFGAITVYSGVYLLFSIGLFAGLAKGHPLLKILLESAFDGLSDQGWLKLSRNWAIFFAFLAILNEAILYVLVVKFPPLDGGVQNPMVIDVWLKTKLYLFTTLSFLFTFAQIPMLLKHGLGEAGEAEVEQNPPAG